jgi:hypothetical protein
MPLTFTHFFFLALSAPLLFDPGANTNMEQAAVDAIGTEELMKCMTIATDLCGMPSLESSGDAVAAQVRLKMRRRYVPL